MSSKTNNQLELAWNFVNFTGRNIFLTGKAGTGKTTFLHRLKNESLKRIVVVAPTGVAAINAGGVTIHSFFQLPFGPIIPGKNGEIKREFKYKFNKKKIDIIRSMDLLVIDEISMVRADLLDGIDQVLRKYKNKNKVFGGMQVLMIGDIQQLAPVVRDHEKAILDTYYDSPFFFSSHSFKQAQPVSIVLKEIFRQQDDKFIRILNEVRENNLSDKSLKELNKRYKPGFNPGEDEGYILLTTHNYKAEKINKKNLEKLSAKSHFFEADIEGDFPENAFPNEERLELKVGAQVMFNKNDSSFEKRYYNGKIGKITAIRGEKIFVKSPEDEKEIEVEKETWNHVTYEVDNEQNTIKEKIKGSFSQIPLKLAWAITIHKSQGLTFDKAIIDAELSFAHGQTYVALSRCKTLEGLVLKSPVKKESVINDQRVTGFNQYIKEHQPDEKKLQLSKKTYQLELIAELFDFYPLYFPVNRLIQIYQQSGSSIVGNFLSPAEEMKNEITSLLKVKENFIRQLIQMSAEKNDLQSDTVINERVRKGVEYFLGILENKINEAYEAFQFDTDNKELRKDIYKQLEKIDEIIAQKRLVLYGISDGFTTKKYLDLRAEANRLKLEKPKKKKDIDVSKLLKHSDLYEALKALRSEFAYEEEVPHFQVFTQESLYEMCEKLPVTQKQLVKINGIGKIRLNKYGEAILNIIKAYCIENNIPLVEDEIEKKENKKPSKEISLELFKQGLKPGDIAKERNLALSTIIGHLSQFIPTGEIQITDLIEEERFKEIKNFIEKAEDFEGLSDLRKQSKNKYDFGELKLVLNHIQTSN